MSEEELFQIKIRLRDGHVEELQIREILEIGNRPFLPPDDNEAQLAAIEAAIHRHEGLIQGLYSVINPQNSETK